ncbi:PIF1-like helicase domain-containing protein [Rhizophagus irregularis DAOM 181602=DAOM 197198]|uniref:ATP-dependent DNA helicase n=1 Tax=Rhizophagus irregularis (strain DAOM 197198w) TaxID=1432141 RepID=A0A015JQA7_RHIIW|nr:Pif1p [Rhizophagus irregularis DAOM 197198w]GBC41360.2 PIF1-like helicase domain-containing protein [Rhizophagus irregularis DAOM 181602=DAOM 197198]
MNYSRNIRAHALYSGILGAFLEPSENGGNNNMTHHLTRDETLQQAATWLSQNNPYLRPYASMISSLQNQISNGPFPTARHAETDLDAPPVNTCEIIIPNYDFPDEVHNEDFHYTRLMAGFIQDSDTSRIPISTYDPNLEPLLFPDIFTDGKGHFHDVLTRSPTNAETRDETYGKYIKLRLMNIDPRWRIHHYWPYWSYLQLEKLRHHQNTQRLLKQSQLNSPTDPLTARDLLQPSSYGRRNIIDEGKTIPIPSFVRTGDTYFHQKELHLNAMIKKLGLPTLFITLSMAENRWTHLHNILSNSDNNDTLPTNRPFHCANYFVHKFQSLKKELYKKPDLTGFGDITDFFDRVEFQNRGAAHTHSCYWTSNSIQTMILNDVIRSTLPDPLLEPELYSAVIANQIHTCNIKCQGPAPLGQTCKKGFPQPFSQTTHYEEGNVRYVYKCLTEADSWVVPYHAPTLLIWDAHMNAQYITDRGFARYMSKYIAKREPSHVFNINENDLLREHVVARRLGSMELMFLLLGHTICNSSATVKFITTEPPPTRSRTILPIYMLEEEDTNPFYDDTIMKYMSRPHLPEFETLTYPQYFEKYSITPSRPVASRRTVYQDDLRNYVVKRTKEIIVRYRFLKIEDGELYFYQQLLHNVPARNESDYKITPNGTYREKFLSLFPDFLNELQNNARTTQQLCITQLNTRFIEMLDRLLQSLHHELPATITQIIQIQMQNLKLLPPLLPETAMLELPRDQYRALSTINTFMGGNDGTRWPYFFITGSAGTGKSYIINMIVNMLNNRQSNFLLLAPTGVSAQNIGGTTIHSELSITSTQGGFYTRSFTNTQLNARLKKVDTLIIEEISMVSAELFDFISNLFARIHNNALAFGGINVVVVGDLAQLPPVTGQPVFRSAVWTLFYPLFLTTPHRQHNDPLFYQILEEVQINNISSRTWNILTNRHSEFILQPSVDTLLNTTHIVGFKETAQKINISICNVLPVPPNNFLLSQSSDFVNSDQWDPSLSDHMFKSKTNLPSFVRLQPCARVMYLNNSLIEYGICNGTIGVVTDVNPTDQYARVAFSVRGSLIDIDIYRQNHYFNINGNNSRRTQFPLQNCFALTVHKTQGLTLQKVSLALDGGIFSPGQAYVALSRCTTWNNVSISHLDRSAFMVDPNVILEYQRLNTIATTNPHVFS